MARLSVSAGPAAPGFRPGNAVTIRSWKDIWLHEGFACYAEWLWSEASGRDSVDAWAEHYWQRLTDLPQDLLLADPSPQLMFDDRVYTRGALTLHALRRTVGDDRFFGDPPDLGGRAPRRLGDDRGVRHPLRECERPCAARAVPGLAVAATGTCAAA